METAGTEQITSGVHWVIIAQILYLKIPSNKEVQREWLFRKICKMTTPFDVNPSRSSFHNTIMFLREKNIISPGPTIGKTELLTINYKKLYNFYRDIKFSRMHDEIIKSNVLGHVVGR